MRGGTVIVVPDKSEWRGDSADQVIIGNCALYGATGGRLFAQGRAGDRFAVRNSGGTAVVEGAGLNCCEYMTGGTVVILGPVAENVGAGMTGGELFLPRADLRFINAEYIQISEESDLDRLRLLLEQHFEATKSTAAQSQLDQWDIHKHQWSRLVPLKKVGTQVQKKSEQALN